jgi:ATP synthase protein I
VNPSDHPVDAGPTEPPESLPEPDGSASDPEVAPVPEQSSGESMQEYFALQRELLWTTLVMALAIFAVVCFTRSLATALSYLLGAMTGLLYLRQLGKAVERIGTENNRLGKSRLGLFIVLVVLASRWQQLELLPTLLGFLTYKVAVMFYSLRTGLIPPADGSA